MGWLRGTKMATDETAKRSNCNHESNRCHALTTASTLMKRIKSEAVNSYLFQVVRTWASRGVKLHVQYEQGAHARYINFSSGLRIRGDRCLDIYRRPQKKGMPRACLPTEIFVERVQNRSPQHAVQSAMAPVPTSRERKQAQTFPVKRSPVKKAPMMAPASTDRERKQALPSPVKRSPVKKSSPKKSSEDPSPVDIWRERYRKKLAALLQNARDKCFFRVDSSRAGAQRSAMKGKLEISVLSLTPELR